MLMLQAGDFKSWISIDGKPRPVFGVETTLKSMTCWIPSESNKKFSVNWHNKNREFPVQATIEIDGVTYDDHIMLDAKHYPNRPHGIGVSYTRTSDSTRRDFMFSPVLVTDNDTYGGATDPPSDIGTIKLRLWKLLVISVLPQPLQPQYSAKLLEGQYFRKPGEHHVIFGDEYASPAPTVDVVHAYKTEDEPFMTFIFKYRPIEILLARGIATRPSLSPTLRSSIPYSPLSSSWREGKVRSNSIDEYTNPSHTLHGRDVGPSRTKLVTRLRTVGRRGSTSSELTSPECMQYHHQRGF